MAQTKRPYPLITPNYDSDRFIDALDTFGKSPDRRLASVINVLRLYGKLDELSEMIEHYHSFVQPQEHVLYTENEEPAPFLAGEFSASDEDNFNNQT
jgi:hypothetical protein